MPDMGMFLDDLRQNAVQESLGIAVVHGTCCTASITETCQVMLAKANEYDESFE